MTACTGQSLLPEAIPGGMFWAVVLLGWCVVVVRSGVKAQFLANRCMLVVSVGVDL